MEFVQQSTEAPSETRAESARVEAGFETLDSNATKAAFNELNSVLDSLAEQIIFTIDQIAPHLAEMQSLLSQRGKSRKKVLKASGVPSWTEYARGFASKLDVSVRTIQDHITNLRRSGKSGPSQSNNKKQPSSPLHLDRRQQATLVKAQLAANEIVTALKSGGDWSAAVASYEKVAVTPSRLDSFVNTLRPEPDWKAVLNELMADLEGVGERLPLSVLSRMRIVQKVLGETPQCNRTSNVLDAVPTNRFTVEVREDGHYDVVNASTQKVWQTYSAEDEANNTASSLNKPVVVLPMVAHGEDYRGATGLDCTGCREMHEGIVQRAQEHPDWNDKQLEEATGCGLTIIRQAKTRFMAWKEAA